MIKFRTRYGRSEYYDQDKDKLLIRKANLFRLEQPEFFKELDEKCERLGEINVVDDQGDGVNIFVENEDLYFYDIKRKILISTEEGKYKMIEYTEIWVNDLEEDDFDDLFEF